MSTKRRLLFSLSYGQLLDTGRKQLDAVGISISSGVSCRDPLPRVRPMPTAMPKRQVSLIQICTFQMNRLQRNRLGRRLGEPWRVGPAAAWTKKRFLCFSDFASIWESTSAPCHTPQDSSAVPCIRYLHLCHGQVTQVSLVGSCPERSSRSLPAVRHPLDVFDLFC